MSNLISYKQRMNLRQHFQYELLKFVRDKKGHYSFTDLLNLKSKLREDAVKRYATEKNVKRIPEYIWNWYNGFFEAIMELNYDEVEGGYMVFGHFYRHSDRKTSFPKAPTWQDLCPIDPPFRQELMKDNYVMVWKNTGKIYTGPEFQEGKNRLVFYKGSAGNLTFRLKLPNGEMSGSHPCEDTQIGLYREALKIMETFDIPMSNAECIQ